MSASETYRRRSYTFADECSGSNCMFCGPIDDGSDDIFSYRMPEMCMGCGEDMAYDAKTCACGFQAVNPEVVDG